MSTIEIMQTENIGRLLTLTSSHFSVIDILFRFLFAIKGHCNDPFDLMEN